MNDRWLILGGLGLFLLLVTWPLWQGLAAGTTSAGPQLPKAKAGTVCVAPVDWMRSSHMELLMAWRDGKVRRQERTYLGSNGTSYAVSLSATCLNQCHGGDQEKFCSRCHAYAGVPAPDCWRCHVAPVRTAALAAGGAQ